MSVVHRVTGYDKTSERLEQEWDVPHDLLRDIRALAHVPPQDQEAAGAYPLDPSVIRDVARAMRVEMSVDRYDWFLEPFAEA